LLTTKTPAEAGAQDSFKSLKKLDSGFHRNDEKETLPFFRRSSRQGFYRSFRLQAGLKKADRQGQLEDREMDENRQRQPGIFRRGLKFFRNLSRCP
jgi:hypothetical protein